MGDPQAWARGPPQIWAEVASRSESDHRHCSTPWGRPPSRLRKLSFGCRGARCSVLAVGCSPRKRRSKRGFGRYLVLSGSGFGSGVKFRGPDMIWRIAQSVPKANSIVQVGALNTPFRDRTSDRLWTTPTSTSCRGALPPDTQRCPGPQTCPSLAGAPVAQEQRVAEVPGARRRDPAVADGGGRRHCQLHLAVACVVSGGLRWACAQGHLSRRPS